MAKVQLGRLVGRRKEVSTIVNKLIKAGDISIGIKDADGRLLLGDDHENPAGKYPVEIEGETLGWVIGGEQAAAVASLLIYLANRELEKKALANEVLDNYRELNLIYKISEKMATTLELEALAQLVVDEAGRLITATDGAVILLDEQTGALKTISTVGQAYQPKVTIGSDKGIIGSVTQSGKAVIVNDVLSDPRFIEGDDKISSLVCSPLKAKQKVIGVILIGNEELIAYTAADLKLLNTIASQAAPAIENALLYEKELKAAKEREERLKQQIVSLRIKLDEAKQQRQVAEITETDYFQQLRGEAESLRKIIQNS